MQLTYPNVEIIVCDNNSSDETKNVIQQYPQIKYIYERKQGLSQAKNALLDACSEDSQFVGFIDDDETVQPDWIEQMLKGFIDDTIATVGGPYHNIYEHEVPSWIPESIYPRSYEIKNDIKISRSFLGIPGGNGMCRLSIIRSKKIYFDVKLGRTGKKSLSGEDNEFYQNVTEPEYKYGFVYSAWINHYIPASRLTFSYLQQLNFWDSVSEYCHRKNKKEYWVKNLGKLLLHILELSKNIFFFNQKMFVKSYLKIVRNAGFLYGTIFCWREKR